MPRSLFQRCIRLATHHEPLALDAVTRNWLVVSGGSFARLALGLVTSIVIARSLGPVAFGVYAVLATSAAITGAVGDFGLTNAAVRRIAAVWKHDPYRSGEIWKAFFWLRVVAVSLLVTLGLLLAGPIARHVIGLPGEAQLLRLALFGVAVTAVSGTTTALLQATGHFGRLTAVMLVNGGLTLILAAGLASIQQLTLHTALIVLGIGTSLASFAIGYRLLPGIRSLALPRHQTAKQDGQDLLRFGAWLWIGGILSVMATQIDVLLVNYWAVPATVGAYSLAVSLASRIEVINHSLYTVLLVSASTIDSSSDLRGYIRSGLLRSAAISLALIPLFPLAGPLISTIYGTEFEPASGLFRSLLILTILNILLTPLLMLAFTFERPKLIAATDGTRLAILFVAGIVLIPNFGATGAIVAKCAATVAGGIVLITMLRRGRLFFDKIAVESD